MNIVKFSSVQSLSRVRLCFPMNHSTPGLPVHHHLPEFTQTHVHRVSDAIQPSHPLLSPSSPVLIAVAKASRTLLNSSGESGHPCLVPDFRGNAFNFSPLRIMFAVGLSYIAFIMLRYVPSIPAFWRVLS